jgi:tRNA pseudouridine38-40 synthase
MNAPNTNWKLILSYDGRPFHGWQVQPALPTVQGTLADAIRQVTGFPLSVPIPPENLLRALNGALPPAIRVLAAEPVSAAFHARHSAVRKTYEYRIFERRIQTAHTNTPTERICPPFLAPYAWDCRWPLQIEPMQQAAALLLGQHDFTSFAASDPDRAQRTANAGAPNPVKTIQISYLARENDLLLYRITGSGFLHHMVRNLIGTLAQVGCGALQPTDILRILAAKNRSVAGPTAPPQGLFLVRVDYEVQP